MTRRRSSPRSPSCANTDADARSHDRLLVDAKLALRRLASAVSVVTCHDDVRNYAMTATSVSALSMEPPSILICVNRSTEFHKALDRAHEFAINILGRAHLSVSKACSGEASGESRFRTGAWDTSGAAPVLADAQAAIICRKVKGMRFGTHTIFMGGIVSVTTNGEVDPLIYLDGRYAARPLEGLAEVDFLMNTWRLP
jgi:flavin reductase (DIM6/NTAB) family NADH-FMN oxidoreductase RutF